MPTAHEDGQGAIELVGYVLLVVLAAVLCVQGVYAAQAASATQEAARNGARALSLGEDWRGAVDRTLPDWVRATAVNGRTDGRLARVEVIATVPIGVADVGFTDLRFSRAAEFPVGR
ncbi:hypothetical protein [Microbacterium sp. NPDC096154]|uniref:hypothetical protein n=1 Tax=Microbacterium sp. NPDC096154 TaxID=3155549 RepID=UPI00332852FE